jgi:hypothetical protein
MAERTDAPRTSLVRLLKFLMKGEAAVEGGEGAQLTLRHREGSHAVAPALLDEAISLGLITATAGSARLAPPARAYLRRAAAEREEAFLEQHGEIALRLAEIDGASRSVRVNEAESPLAALSRLKDKGGSPFLPKEALAAGERLLADFTRAQLQPRVTSSWQPRLSGRIKGERGGMADLADGAVAARIAVNRAIEAMGPELSGVALDVCCFMKGLETVERERQWPVRSAKLMLRTALLALSRHYNPPHYQGRMQHWGAEGYRPDL